MAYVQLTVTSPNNLLTQLRDYALSVGWVVLADLVTDTSLDGLIVNDGLRLSLQSPSGKSFANFRSANGKSIFPSQAGAGYGVGLTCSHDFTANPPSGFWYDQPGGITDVLGKNIGVGIPLPAAGSVNCFFNHVSDPAEMILISIEVLPNVYQHMAVGETEKVGAWFGGTVFSASRNSYNMFSSLGNKSVVEAESNHLFATNATASTFLMIDVDSAPQRNPGVRWASAGPNNASPASCYTGKLLGLPVVTLNCLSMSWRPKIPHYGYLQSQNASDSGRNCNTLNCITVDLPLSLYIQRDPDALMNFSLVGYVPGIYFVSTRNVAAGHTYEISYPQSGQLHQVFPHTRRAGIFGYDGLSVKQ